MAKVIPEKIIEHCKDCSEAPLCNEYKDPYFGDDIPSDCPLKDYKCWIDKPDSDGWWWILFRNGELEARYLTKVDGRKYYGVKDTGLITQDVVYCNTKWHKAVVPTIPEEDK